MIRKWRGCWLVFKDPEYTFYVRWLYLKHELKK